MLFRSGRCRTARRIRDHRLPIALRPSLIAGFKFQLAAILHRIGAARIERERKIDVGACVLAGPSQLEPRPHGYYWYQEDCWRRWRDGSYHRVHRRYCY